MKLNDLQTGMVVVLRNEEPYIVSRNCAFHSDVLAGYKNFWELWNTQIDFNRYNEDMTFKGKNMELFDIMRIYEESRDSIPFSKGKLLWQREEYKEVTMKEIEEKYGCKVKIVGLETNNYEWISCKERLPEELEDVLVALSGRIIGDTCDGEYREDVCIGYYNGYKWCLRTDLDNCKVNYWMPLPKPYKESEE